MNELAMTKTGPLEIDARTISGEQPSQPLAKTAQEFRAVEINAVLQPAYLKAGTLQLTPEESAKLTAKFPRSCMDRKMGKFLYIPHIFISQRLCEVFGPGQWTMIRRDQRMEGNMIMAEWVMIIRGVYIGESWGAQEYHPNNAQQTYADVLEATRGECIRRIAGKYLSCGEEAWDPAVQKAMDYQKTRERLEAPTPPPMPAASAPPAPASVKVPISPIDAAKKRLWSLYKPFCKSVGEAETQLRTWNIITADQTLAGLTLPQIEKAIEQTEIQLKGE